MVLPPLIVLDRAVKLLEKQLMSPMYVGELLAQLAGPCGDHAMALMANKALLVALQKEKGSDVSTAQQQLALAHCWLDEYEEATPLFEQSLHRFCDKYGATSDQTKRAESLLQWCRRQRTAPSVVNHSRISCLLAFQDATTIAVQCRLAGIQAAVVFGAAAGNADVSHPYKLRPLSATHPNVLYYEVIIGAGEAEGKAPGCTVGFSSASHLLCSEPGIESASIGLRATQTVPSMLLHSDGSGKSDYAPKVSSGSVMGVGMDIAAGIVFFTVDGVRYKDVPAEVSCMPFACLIFNDVAEAASSFALNFGDAPFKYQPTETRHRSLERTRVDPQCSWLVTFDSPLELRPTIPNSGESANALLHDAAAFSLRTLPNSSVLYYEAHLLDTGEFAQVYIGYGCADATCVANDTIPGWSYPPSIAYGARDGQLGALFLSDAHESILGPPMKLNDVCGCGLDRDAGVVFFVINGQRLADVAIKDAHLLVAPMVGFGGAATTERVRLNFGDSPFKYDHAAYLQAIAASPPPVLPADFPFRQPHKKCSWLVTFDSPLEFRCTMPQPGVAGSALLLDRAFFSLRALPNSSVLYYELHVLDSSATNHAAFGFGRANSNVSVLPGFTNSPSIGYNGAGGQVRCRNKSPATVHKSVIGPKLTKGDVAGCGVDRAAGVVFFVINGRRLPDIKVKEAELLVAPMVGFGPKATTERVRLNFGDEPFKYNHAEHKDEQPAAGKKLADKKPVGKKPAGKKPPAESSSSSSSESKDERKKPAVKKPAGKKAAESSSSSSSSSSSESDSDSDSDSDSCSSSDSSSDSSDSDA
jgi:hypothetical protein